MLSFLNETWDDNNTSTDNIIYNETELEFFNELKVPSLSPSTTIKSSFSPTFSPTSNSSTSSHFIEQSSSTSSIAISNSSLTDDASTMTATSILHVIVKYGLYSAFALSPIAAYLPQYWKLLPPQSSKQSQQSSSTSSKVYSTIKRDETTNIVETNNQGNENNQSHNSSLTLHPRTLHQNDKINTVKNEMFDDRYEQEDFVEHPPHQTELTSSSISEKSDSKSCDSTDAGGFSSSTTLILLVSHMWRLLYFYGCTTSANAEDVVQYDLMSQSIVMILMQFLLLYALVQQKKMSSHSFDNPNKHNPLRQPSLQLSTSNVISPMSMIESAYSYASFQHKSLCNYHLVWCWDTLCPYFMFWGIITWVSFLTCQFGLFRLSNDGDNSLGVHIIRNSSILLESCLPLPQFFRNFVTKSTEGLSIVMVLAWISGDSMKFFYYFIGSTNNDGNSRSSSGTPAIFYWGCILCLFFDFLVGLQILVWYPTKQVRQWTTLLKRRNKKYKKKYSFETIDGTIYSNENVVI